jgi:hypothetical protein
MSEIAADDSDCRHGGSGAEQEPGEKSENGKHEAHGITSHRVRGYWRRSENRSARAFNNLSFVSALAAAARTLA